jgi:hypothetical protein
MPFRQKVTGHDIDMKRVCFKGRASHNEMFIEECFKTRWNGVEAGVGVSIADTSLLPLRCGSCACK